jgi:hypothetical protein
MSLSKQDNIIDWFQEKMGAQYPEKVQALLKVMAASECTIEILFKIPDKWWRLKVLDFQLLDAIKNNPAYTTNDFKERFTNPYFISIDIDEHNQEYTGENQPTGKALPFAVDIEGDGCDFLYYSSEDNVVYNCNLNSILPGEVFLTDIEVLLGSLDDIIREISENGKTSFEIDNVYVVRPPLEKLVEKKNIFVCDGECVDEVMAYQWIIEQLTEISDGLLTLESFEGTDGHTRTINVTINGISGQFTVKGKTDWIDSAIILALNELLKPVMKDKFFIEVYDERWGQEFGVVYGDKTMYDLLLKNFLIPVK